MSRKLSLKAGFSSALACSTERGILLTADLERRPKKALGTHFPEEISTSIDMCVGRRTCLAEQRAHY